MPRLLSVLILLATLVTGTGAVAAPPDDTPLSARLVHRSWNTDHGMPQNAVRAIAQTPDGFIWIGTEEGLARFDGLRFTSINAQTDSAFQSIETISALYADPVSGFLWIGAHEGLLLRHPDGSYQTFPTLEGTRVGRIAPGADGQIWVATYEAGLHVFKDGALSRFAGDPLLTEGVRVTSVLSDTRGELWIGTDRGLHRVYEGQVTVESEATGLRADLIRVLYQDTMGTIWVGTQEGLHRYGADGRPIALPEGVPATLQVHAIAEAGEGRYWFGTDGDGLALYEAGRMSWFATEHGLPNDRVMTLENDFEGSLWVGTEGGGLSQMYFQDFVHVGAREGLPVPMALSVYEAPDASVWIGTMGGGLVHWDDGRMTTYGEAEGIGNPNVLSVLGTADGAIWAGTYGGGVTRFKDGRAITFTADNGFPGHAVFVLHEAADGALWMVTDAGLVRYADGTFAHWSTEDGLPFENVTALITRADGSVWFGGYAGQIARFVDNRFEMVKEGAALGNNAVTSFYEDERERLWIGTYGSGLVVYDGAQLRSISTPEGLLSSKIFHLLADDEGYFWVSNNMGLHRIHRGSIDDVLDGTEEQVVVRTYSASDGLRSTEMNGGSLPGAWHGPSGTIWFPSTAGAVGIDPAELSLHTVPPRVALEGLTLNDTPALVPDSLRIEAGLRKITVHFAGLSFRAPEHLKFRFRLDGYDTDWSPLSDARSATYTNLPPGRYTFHVEARTADGTWSARPAEVHFVLAPYFWQTTWFLLFGLGLVLLLAFGVYRFRLRQLRSREKWLRRRVDEQTQVIVAEKALTEQALAEVHAQKEEVQKAKSLIEDQADKLQAMDKLKTRFFNNISHEFRTPLTLMIGPLENALTGAYGPVTPILQQQHRVMLRNSRRLLRLINQLLDLAKLETGSMKVNKRHQDLMGLTEGIVLSFTAFAEARNVELVFESDEWDVECAFDAEKIEKVLFNLLSNAMKFTPAGGRIVVRIDVRGEGDQQQVSIAVKDTGTGIPADQVANIFDRFHQVDGAQSNVQEGTGIGLALAKELVELHDGDIRVESEVGVGTAFIVELPLDSSLAGSQDEQVAPTAESTRNAFAEMVVADPEEMGTDAGPAFMGTAPDDAPLVLSVDDNSDVREYVMSCLGANFRVVQAKDGVEGLAMAREHRPDLILSDVMMPKMDGYEMTQHIKSDPDLKHIPIILLTAKASVDMKIEGLEQGADDYVPKPFNQRELVARIRNLLQLREQARQLKDFNDALEQKVQEQLDLILEERNRYEAELLDEKERAEASARLKAAILDNVSHEFRTPVTAIQGFAQILAMEAPGELHTFTEEIETNGARLVQTLDALLELSQLDSSSLVGRHIREVDIGETLEDVLAGVRATAEAKGLVVEIEREPVPAVLDQEALRSVLEHVLDNAVKFTEAGSVQVRVRTEGEQAVIEVVDTGVGISDAFLPDIYEAFKQESDGLDREFEGMGIGMTVVHRLVDRMGGIIAIDSVKHEGTTVRLTFPVAASDAGPTALAA